MLGSAPLGKETADELEAGDAGVGSVSYLGDSDRELTPLIALTDHP